MHLQIIAVKVKTSHFFLFSTLYVMCAMQVAELQVQWSGELHGTKTVG